MHDKVKIAVILLLLATLFKGLLWIAVLPVWHGPDEQAHFAQVQYYAETKHGFRGDNDLSREIYESEELLGTLRDGRGVNKFTYHPDYRIEYTDNFTGLYERLIADFPRDYRTTFVKTEAARYPPLFYILSSAGYLTAYPADLFTRVAAVRVVSLVFSLLTVWFSFLLGRSVFPQSRSLPVAVAAFVSFQPMYTFISSSVNNDNLLILISTILIWLMVDSLRRGFTAPRAIGMGICLGLGILTKQLMYIFIPLPLFAALLSFFLKGKEERNSQLQNLFLFLLFGLLFGGALFTNQWLKTGHLPGWPGVNPASTTAGLAFSDYLRDKLGLLYRETLPWYWGVFNWLGVVLPLTALRIIKVFLLLSGLGLLIHFGKALKRKKFSISDLQLLFLLFVSLWYAFFIIFWDYSLVKSIGFSHGLQGRYFFPGLSAQMTILVFGLSRLAGQYRQIAVKFSLVAMVVLNLIALRTMAACYYDFVPFLDFFIQASQYKPWFFKGFGLVFLIAAYLTAGLNFINYFFSLKETKK